MEYIKFRKAMVQDAKTIQQLINSYARRDLMLPRSLNEIYENIRDHIVCEIDGKVAGVCALHILWEDLAEIRSLAVNRDAQRKGIGSKLVRRALREAKALGVRKVFVLTYQPDFFRNLGFQDIEKSTLPQKIWGDCLRCHKFPECDEHALIKEIF
jgi:amino-acid N-acetyltransferase